MSATAEQYISTKEAANELRVDVTFIRNQIKAGKLPALKISPRKYRISKEDWELYKSSKKV